MNNKKYLGVVIFGLLFGCKTGFPADSHPLNQKCPHATLDGLDKRIPVPLLPHMALHQKQNMREHLESVQGIVTGLATKDFKTIETSASKMGFSEQMGQMCERMGAGAAGFTEQAISFHKSADQIAVAARKLDERGVIKALQTTLSKCTACHAVYRQQIVDEATMKFFSDKVQRKSQ